MGCDLFGRKLNSMVLPSRTVRYNAVALSGRVSLWDRLNWAGVISWLYREEDSRTFDSAFLSSFFPLSIIIHKKKWLLRVESKRSLESAPFSTNTHFIDRTKKKQNRVRRIKEELILSTLRYDLWYDIWNFCLPGCAKCMVRFHVTPWNWQIRAVRHERAPIPTRVFSFFR